MMIPIVILAQFYIVVEAAKCGGNGQLHNMKTIIKSHVRSNKEMYEEAKNAMLEKVDALKVCHILKCMLCSRCYFFLFYFCLVLFSFWLFLTCQSLLKAIKFLMFNQSTILEDLEKAMTESIEFSLRTDNNSLPGKQNMLK